MRAGPGDPARVERGHGAGAVREPRRGRGRDHAVELGERAARGQLRVPRRLGHGKDRGDARVRSEKNLCPFFLRALREPGGEPLPQFRPPGAVMLAGQVGRHPVRREQQLDQPRVELRLERADRHVTAVGRLVDVVERCPGVQPVHAPLVGPRAVGEQPVGHRLQHRGPVHDRGVDHLAAPGLPGPQQRGEQAEREEQRPAAEVAEVVHRDLGRAAGPPDRVQCPGDRDVGDVVPGRFGERAVLPPAGHPAVHQPRVACPAGGGSDAEAFGDPGPVALDERVGGRGEPQHDLGAAGMLQVDDDPPLAPACDVLVEGDRRRRAARPVHPDHLGAEVGEQHPAERSRPDPRQLDNPHTGQRPLRVAHGAQCATAIRTTLTITRIIATAR